MAFTFNLPVNTGYMSNVKSATRGLHHEGEFMSKVTLTFWNKKLEDLRPRTKSQEMCSVKIKYSQEEENILLNNQRHEYHPLTIQYLTLKMTTAQVVETSVTVTNSSFQNYTHPDDHNRQTTDTPGFKPFALNIIIFFSIF